MKTCSRCGRSYPDAQLACSACGIRLPQGEAADMQTVSHINYLLGELPQWVMAGWMDPKQAQHLGDRYERRRDEILSGGIPAPAWSSAQAPPMPEWPKPADTAGSAAPSPAPPAAPLAAFREDRSLSYWHLMGALLLLVGLVGLIRWTWESPGGKSLVFALMLGLTGGLAALTRLPLVREERITAGVLTALAALLVPLDLVAANAFLLFGGQLTTEGIGMVTTLVCLPLYAWLAGRRSSRTFLVFAVLDFSISVHFLLQAILPTLLHTHSPLRLYGAYGPVYVVLSALYLVAAVRGRQAEARTVWRALMHITTLTALGVALVTGDLTTFGSTAATLLLAGALYAAAGIRLNQSVLALPGVALTVFGAGLALAAGHVPVGTCWYIYVLTVLAIAFGLHGLSWLISKEAVAHSYARSAFLVTGLAVLAQALWVVTATGKFPSFSFSGGELGGALACAALSALFFAWARSRRLGDGMLAYGVVLLGLLAAHSIRATVPGNVGLSLAVAAAGLSLWRHDDSARVCGWAALAVCGAYVLHGGFLGTESLALLLLLGMSAWSGGVNGAAPAVWLALASATTLILLWESRGLPSLRTHVIGEANNGDGLFLLTVACLGLYSRRRIPALRQGAAALGIGNAALQMVYALNGSYPYSPLALLASGIALTVGIAWVRRSERFTLWATTLAAYAYLTFLAGLVVHSPPARETISALTILASALTIAALAQQQRRPYLAFAAPIAGAIGWAHGVHHFWHPSAVDYAPALLPLVILYYALAIARARQADDLWPAPLQQAGLITATLALLPSAGEFLGTAPSADVPTVMTSLLLYGLLFAVVAWFGRSAVSLYTAAVLLNGAYLFGLLHHTPPLSRPLVSLWLGIAGLAWLGVATVWQRLPGSVASLFPVAAGVALVTAGLALTDMHGEDALYALLIAGTTFAGMAWGSGQSGWAHLGVWTYLLAYIAWLWNRIGAPGMTDSDYFLIPVGLYVLALGLLARRGLLDASAPPFLLAGLLLILTPTYLAARQPGQGLLHALLLAGECLTAIFYGLAGRVKVFLGAGTAFLLLWVHLSLSGSSGQGDWAVSAVLLGLAIIGSALYLEKRRDKRVRLTQAARQEWQRWE